MSNYKEKQVLQEDGIDLATLFTIFWDRKLLIICMTLIGAILAGLLSLIMLSPAYVVKLDIVIKIPQNDYTRFGEYTHMTGSAEEYRRLVKDEMVLFNTANDLESVFENPENVLKGSISVGDIGEDQASFTVRVSADNADDALKIADTLYENYTEYIDITLRGEALRFYNDKFNKEISSQELLLTSQKKELEDNETLLSDIPKFLDIHDFDQGQTNSDIYIIIENILNPNYTMVENNIILNKQSINNTENTISDIKLYLEAIDNEYRTIESYYETGEFISIDEPILNTADNYVYLAKPLEIPKERASYNYSKRIILGAAVGLFLGIGISLIKKR